MHTETQMQAPTRPVDLPPERKAEEIRALLGKAPGHRLVLLHILSLCETACPASELDAQAMAFMKGQVSLHAPSTLRQWLWDAGGLEVVKIGEGEAARDDWRITPAGQIALASMSLSREMMDLLHNAPPDHRQTYLKVLRFCELPRTREEIERHLEGDPSICPPETYPSTFIAPLEDVGAVRWTDKWMTTDTGKQACV